MLKKFVPLNSTTSPSKNPYEIRTYMGETDKQDWKADPPCRIERKCDGPQNSTISKVITIEDEIRRLNQKAKETRFMRPYKKKCALYDDYTVCIATQRTPQELKTHAVMREHYISTKYEWGQSTLDGRAMRIMDPTIVQLPETKPKEDETEEEVIPEEEDEDGEEAGDKADKKEVKPQPASLACSLEAIYVPPPKLLELKRPKSGYFHNETPAPVIEDDGIPYSRYDPRILQQQFDEQGLKKIDLIEGKDPNEIWTWNIGLQKRESDLDHAFLQAAIPKLECNNWDLTAFKIPKDLDKTFTAEIVFGNKKVLPEVPPRKPAFYNRPREVACAMVAYVESFHLNPDFWTASTMDGIIKIAENLLKKSDALNFKSEMNDIDLVNHIPERKAVVGLRLHYTGSLKNEPNIYKTLTLYFSKYNAAVFTTHNLRFLILKRCLNSYFVFDPNGRNDQCQRDFERGKCSLMKMQYVEHLVHLIVNFSSAQMEDDFNLYEVFLLNFGKIDEPWPEFRLRMTRRRWAVVNDAYAVIPSWKEGLSPPYSAKEHNASMVVSLFALIYADIERAMEWRMETIDDLIRFGMVFNRHLRLKYRLRKQNQHLNIIDMPTAVMMVTYRCFLKKFPFLYTGHVAECKSFADSQLTTALKELFSSRWEAALLQIDNSVLAVWRDTEVFYVFDPFRRGSAGQVLDPDDYRARGAAVLQMHSNFESFCRMIYQKALKMRRGGKFFLHGINVGCIKPKRDYIVKNKYPKLKLLPPEYGEEADIDPMSLVKKGDPIINVLKEEERLPEYDEDDVIDQVLDDIVCELLNAIMEPPLGRPQLYKQAKRILLRSDKDYLKSLKHKLLHKEDYDNMLDAFQTTPDQRTPLITIEEELAIPSNYVRLPDGTWVVFGTTDLPEMDDEPSKLNGLLAGITTLVLASKYKISTWSAGLINYAVDSFNHFGEDYKDYQSVLVSMLSKRLPKVALGQNEIYEMSVKKIIKSTCTRPLRQVLLETLISHSRLLVICQRFSCVIIKRYNFLYMFIGYPCNAGGYRKFGSGKACMLRLIELDSLISRIEFGCNPAGCEITNYVVLAIRVTNLNMTKFKEWPKHKQQEMVDKEMKRQKEANMLRNAKMRFLDDSLRKENERLEKFAKEKRKRDGTEKPKKGKRVMRYQYDDEGEEIGMEEELEGVETGEEEGEEHEEEIELKHKPGKRLAREKTGAFKPHPISYGYHMRVADCLFKIQGSTALTGRDTFILDQIQPCFFASSFAVLYVILKPLNEWHSQRVDQVIESANRLADKVTDWDMTMERTITNATVDEFRFDIWVRNYEARGVAGTSIKRQLLKATTERKCLLLFTGNGTYAIYRDEYYHLFDPYPSMEKANDGAEEGDDDDEESHKKHCKRGIKRYGERNTASWILFLDVDRMLKYISERCTNANWKEQNEFKFFVVDVLSYRKAPQNELILRLLTDISIPRDCDISKYGDSEFNVCAHMESMSWLDLENCLPVWSRLNRRNTAGRYRNLPISKLKKYDIEIEGRLWSLWGYLHPDAPTFPEVSRGKQYLACYVVACCATRIFHLMDWSAHLLDTIIISGDRYHRESLSNIKRSDYEFSLEDLGTECFLENIKFLVNIQYVAFGMLYSQPKYERMNLSEALIYFFSRYTLGILQCHNRALAIGFTDGHDGGYFMFDCQTREHPLYPKGQGASYLLRTRHLQVLLYCIVVTLNVPYYNMEFTLHQIELMTDGGSVVGEEEEMDDDDGADIDGADEDYAPAPAGNANDE